MIPHVQRFTVFDIETTGLDPRAGDRIVEIAGVHVESGRIDEHHPFTSLVNPDRLVSSGAGRVHGILAEDLRRAPLIHEVLPAFLSYAEGSVLVAHNAPFDCAFLEVEKEACWGYVEIPPCLCTRALSRAVCPEEYGHGLDAAARRLGLNVRRGCHRALSDAILTAEVFLRLIERGGIMSLEELRGMAALAHSGRPGAWP